MVSTLRNSYRPETPAGSIKGLWAACFLGAALLYILTSQRGVSWQDSGMFQWRVWTGDLTGELGLALAHPLYIAAAQVFRLLPDGLFCAALNAFSGLGTAVAVATLAVVVALLTGRRWTGLAAAGMLSVAHTVWWLSTIAEVYTWSVAGLAVELLVLVRLMRRPDWRKLALLAGVNGAGLCVHNFALLPLPVYLVVGIWLVARRRLPAWALAAAGGAWLAGASLYLAMIAREALAPGGGLAAAVSSALFGRDYAAKVAGGGSWRLFRVNAALGGMNFTSFLLPLAAVGWVRLRRRLGTPLAAALGAITVIEVLFVVRYPVPDQFTFLLPSLVMIALAAGVGLGVLADASVRWRRAAIAAAAVSVAMPPAVYAAAPSLLDAAGVDVARPRKLPRDEARYWLAPWKHNEHSAERFARAALRRAAPDGVILPDSTSAYPLLLVQDRDAPAPDVVVQFRGPLPSYRRDPNAFRAALGDRPLYLVTRAPGYVPDGLARGAPGVRHEQAGPLWRVVWTPAPDADG